MVAGAVCSITSIERHWEAFYGVGIAYDPGGLGSQAPWPASVVVEAAGDSLFVRTTRGEAVYCTREPDFVS
jgi:hypothetical protein